MKKLDRYIEGSGSALFKKDDIEKNIKKCIGI
jgi:hypothetical protein